MKEFRPRLTEEEYQLILKNRGCSDGGVKESSKKQTKIKAEKEPFVLSAWNKDDGTMMDIDVYCEYYSLPRKDIKSYKLVSHTGTPYYNILFKENIFTDKDIDFDAIIEKYAKPIKVNRFIRVKGNDCFNRLVYTDVHIGMDTDKNGNSMYPVLWNREEALKAVNEMITETISKITSSTLYVDELGDFLDGYNALTTRGGHSLPQNMTNEESFDCALEFKIMLMDGLVEYFDRIIFNNICNDNHAGSFGYFVNKAFAEIARVRYETVTVHNYRQFINHYFVDDIAFVITHGKDDSALKFGFKPQLDSSGMEKIDQYCKQNNIYKKANLVIFCKGDSHQTLFDMCTSDDFYYFNYPALSPSSNWVQSNFKKGRRGFVNESYNKLDVEIKPRFL